MHQFILRLTSDVADLANMLTSMENPKKPQDVESCAISEKRDVDDTCNGRPVRLLPVKLQVAKQHIPSAVEWHLDR